MNNSIETLGALRGTGNSLLRISFGGANTALLTAVSFAHWAGNGIDLIDGVSPGANSTAAASTDHIFFTAATELNLIGTTAALSTGDNSAPQNATIVPYFVGDATTSTSHMRIFDSIH